MSRLFDLHRRRRSRRLAAATALIVAVDLGTKLGAVALARDADSGLIVPSHNPAFSLGVAHAPISLAALLAVVGIAIVARLSIGPALRGAMSPWIPAALIGGAGANLIDRVLFGAVHDFLATPIIILNVADIAVVAGLIALTVHLHRVHAPGRSGPSRGPT